MTREIKSELRRQLTSRQLSAVTFVQDYLQLEFDPPPRISIFTQVTVESGGRSFTSGMRGFRDLLCGQIAKVVKSVEVRDGEALDIIFDDDSIISVSLGEEDYQGPEAVVFWGEGDSWFVI